ncbi:MAG: Flavoredoxin [Promethearchaeota archaeon]|jgi:flavin reductase (DIM6/NTAB) family NADH-FMN oxidoreductase RutF|nr:MAG: Flavoredoxin [Candidatus Lokiarchaeota archaeon]
MLKNKIKIGPYLYPMPVVLIGALIEERANFMPIAWTCIAEHKPPMILISASHTHLTNKGIKENQCFSVNFTSEDMVIETDYCGIKSGKDINKSTVFKVFYGDLKKAPMINESPINLECKVDKIIDNQRGHDIIIGEIVNAYAEDKYLTNGIPDIKKLNPLIFSMNDNNYWKLGEHIGRAWKIGHQYESK